MTTSPTPPREPMAEDGLDRLLRGYFRTKMPRSFPDPLPATSGRAAMAVTGPSSLSRGRLVLAACVAAVVLGFGYLLATSNHGPTEMPAAFDGSTAEKNGHPLDSKKP